MQRQGTPFVAHVFVCVNERDDGSKSCGDGLGSTLKALLKAGVEARGWKGRVRVSQTGCMGLCARGPNVMIHPQGVWFAGVSPEDVPAILDEVGRRMTSG
jgi:(2Fe-2S) ferredoxin